MLSYIELFFVKGDGYTDGRYPAPAECLTANLGRMPIAEIGDTSIGQSGAITFYFAAEYGLLGDNNLEAAQILAISEHLSEMLTAFRTVVPFGSVPTPESLEKWFETGATDITGPAVGADRSTRYMKWWLGRIEAVLGNNGFAVGNKLSLADVLMYNIFGETLRDEEAKESAPIWRRTPMSDAAHVEAALAAHPKIKASVDAVANNVNFQKYLRIRGPQGF